MAKPRIELQNLLVEVLGSKNVYFQPPMNITMKYPCIRYERSKIDHDYADNHAYTDKKSYTLTVIYKDPDSSLPDDISRLPMCKHSQHYVADNLHHDIFNIYF